MFTNLSFAFPVDTCRVAVYSSVTWSKISLSMISLCYNIPEKITRVWLAENESIFHVTQVQFCYTEKFTRAY